MLRSTHLSDDDDDGDVVPNALDKSGSMRLNSDKDTTKHLLWSALCRGVYRKKTTQLRRYPGVCLDRYLRARNDGSGLVRDGLESQGQARVQPSSGYSPMADAGNCENGHSSDFVELEEHEQGEKNEDDGVEDGDWLISSDDELVFEEEEPPLHDDDGEGIWNDYNDNDDRIIDIDMPGAFEHAPYDDDTDAETTAARHPFALSSRLLSSDDYSLLHDISQQSSFNTTVPDTEMSTMKSTTRGGQGDEPPSEFQTLESEEILLEPSTPCRSESSPRLRQQTAPYKKHNMNVNRSRSIPISPPPESCYDLKSPVTPVLTTTTMSQPPPLPLHPSSPPLDIIDEDLDEDLDCAGGGAMTTSFEEGLGCSYLGDAFSSDTGILFPEGYEEEEMR